MRQVDQFLENAFADILSMVHNESHIQYSAFFYCFFFFFSLGLAMFSIFVPVSVIEY